VVFQDETGFTLHPRLGFGWARRGERLRVPTTSQHGTRLNLSGWVAPLLGRHDMIRTEHGNREGFLEVLSHLYRRLRRYRISLYVDGAGWHKGAPVRAFLRTHPRLRLHYLPPTSRPSTCKSDLAACSLRGHHQPLVRNTRRDLGDRAANNRRVDASEAPAAL
jgi:hypothetical protein